MHILTVPIYDMDYCISVQKLVFFVPWDKKIDFADEHNIYQV
jgi:hypothetical protein